VIDGYDADMTEVSGQMPAEDLNVIVTYRLPQLLTNNQSNKDPWALVDLLLALVTLAISGFLLFRAFNKDNSWEKESIVKRRKLLAIASLIISLGIIVLFAAKESFALPMQMFGSNSIIVLLLTLGHLFIDYLSFKRK